MLFKKCPKCGKSMVAIESGGHICVACGNIIKDIVVDCPDFLKDIFQFN